MKILILIIFLLLSYWEAFCSDKIEWRTMDLSKPPYELLQGAVLGGNEEGTPLYVCRAWHNDSRWVPGKFFHDEGEYFCHIEERSMQHEYNVSFDSTNIQVLFAPETCISWVPPGDRFRIKLPPNSISGGSHPAGDEAYICRHRVSKGRVINGKYWTHDGKCYFPMDGQAYPAVLYDIELLTVNMLGMQKCLPTSKNMTEILLGRRSPMGVTATDEYF